MYKIVRASILISLFSFCVNNSNAAIIGVLTESTAMATFERLDVDGNPFTVSYSGPQISEEFGGVGLGAATSFDTTSRVGEGVVEFQNGSASYGQGVESLSRTVVDVFFQNTSNETIRPTLNSQITPAGLGMYVSGCQATNLRQCEIRDDGDYDWQDVGNLVPVGDAAVGTRFDFKVMSGEDTLFSLSGGLSLIIGDDQNPNQIVQDFSEVENFLTNFRQTSPNDSQQQISFDWEATDFTVEFPETLMLAPGEFGNLTYITEVTTFSKAFCFGQGRQACPIAYGSFGDPVGRGGGARPRFGLFDSDPLNDESINGLDFGLFEFSLPTFENGQIGYQVISGPGINQVNSPNLSFLVFFMPFFLAFRLKIKR